MLRSLEMHGIAQAVTALMEQGSPAFEAAVPVLFQRLKTERAEREVGSISYHRNAALFSTYPATTATASRQALPPPAKRRRGPAP
jgi:hypothetical protein